MRNALINRVLEEAKKNSNIVLMTADLGYSVTDKFAAELPDQFFNTGIAEQNTIGVAAGLALSGKKVFVYSFATFATARCLEQIRLDVCYHNLDVTIIGASGGFASGTLGVTHYGLEDIANVRSLPHMKVMSPADPWEAKLAAEYALANGGPAYIRVNRSGEADIMETKPAQINFSNPILLNEGNNDLVVFSTGNVTSEAYKAVKSLNEEKNSIPAFYSVPLLKPLDIEKFIEIIKNKKVVFTVEEHTIVGGLGTAIAEIIAENMLSVRLIRLGTPDAYFDFIGKQDFMRDAAGISADKIKKVILQYE